MNDHQSPYSHMDDDRSSSPKRRKIRQKYAPKACVSCRKSKLKCTGENPCQRCVDNGKRCFYSEDQTAAEMLQNLSRPTPTPSQPSLNSANGNGASRRSTMNRNGTAEHQESENNAGTMSMESRMARLEAMMEALMQERGLSFTPTGSTEREDTESEGFKSQISYPRPIFDPIDPHLQQLGQPSPEPMNADPVMGPDTMPSVRVGDQTLPFPDPARYQQYVASFFGDIHLRYPCVDEVEFNARVQRLMTIRVAEPNDVHFLALCYLLFACCDVLHEVTSSTDRAPGSDWFQLADSIIDKRSLLAGDVDLVQCFLFQAIYLTYADIPAAAYGAIRTACSLVFQTNMHRQESWIIKDLEREYWQLCVVWTAYIADQLISISCGRPASMHVDDLAIETPSAYCKRTPLPPVKNDHVRRAYGSRYLDFQLCSVRFAAEWAAKSPETEVLQSENETFRLMQRFSGYMHKPRSPHIPNFSPQDQLNPILKDLTALRLALIPLLVGRRFITKLAYSSDQAEHFGKLAMEAVSSIRKLMSTPAIMTAPSHWHQLTSAIAATLLVLAALLVRVPSMPGANHLSYRKYIECFEECAKNLSQMAHGLPYAKRIHDDCSPLIEIGMAVVERWKSLSVVEQFDHGWDAVLEVVPPHVAGLFPYQSISPSLQGPVGAGGDLFGGERGADSGVLWLF